MRVVMQRVKRASVAVEQEGADEATTAPQDVISEIGKGIVCLVGVNEADEPDDALWICKQITSAKLFEGMSEANADKRWRSSVKQNGFEILLVSQVRRDTGLKRSMTHASVYSVPTRAIWIHRVMWRRSDAALFRVCHLRFVMRLEATTARCILKYLCRPPSILLPATFPFVSRATACIIVIKSPGGFCDDHCSLPSTGEYARRARSTSPARCLRRKQESFTSALCKWSRTPTRPSWSKTGCLARRWMSASSMMAPSL